MRDGSVFIHGPIPFIGNLYSWSGRQMANSPTGRNGGEVVNLPAGVRVCLIFGRKEKRLMGTAPVITLSNVVISGKLFYKSLIPQTKSESRLSTKYPALFPYNFFDPPISTVGVLKTKVILRFSTWRYYVICFVISPANLLGPINKRATNLLPTLVPKLE